MESKKVSGIKKRNDGIDFVKGVCILSVVLAHAISFSRFPVLIEKISYAVVLNCFFCVQGYLFYTNTDIMTRKNMTDRLKKKFISLIIPYLSFSILAIVWHGILAVGFDCREISDIYFGWNIVFRDIWCIISGIGIGTLWFLPVLFVSYALLVITVYLTNRRKKTQIIVMMALFIISVMLSRYIFALNIKSTNALALILLKYKTTLYRILFGFGYSLFGYLIHMFFSLQHNTRKSSVYLLSICLILSILGYHLNLTMVFEVTVCTLFFTLAVVVLPFAPKSGLTKALSPVIYCGKNSLAIMTCHYLLLFPLEKMCLNYIGGYRGLPQVSQELIFFCINLLSTLLVVEGLNHTEFGRFILGKRKRPNSLKQASFQA